MTCDAACWHERDRANRECYARMELELDEALEYMLEHREVLAVKSERGPVRNAAVEGAAWADDPA